MLKWKFKNLRRAHSVQEAEEPLLGPPDLSQSLNLTPEQLPTGFNDPLGVQTLFPNKSTKRVSFADTATTSDIPVPMQPLTKVVNTSDFQYLRRFRYAELLGEPGTPISPGLMGIQMPSSSEAILHEKMLTAITARRSISQEIESVKSNLTKVKSWQIQAKQFGEEKLAELQEEYEIKIHIERADFNYIKESQSLDDDDDVELFLMEKEAEKSQFTSELPIKQFQFPSRPFGYDIETAYKSSIERREKTIQLANDYEKVVKYENEVDSRDFSTNRIRHLKEAREQTDRLGTKVVESQISEGVTDNFLRIALNANTQGEVEAYIFSREPDRLKALALEDSGLTAASFEEIVTDMPIHQLITGETLDPRPYINMDDATLKISTGVIEGLQENYITIRDRRNQIHLLETQLSELDEGIQYIQSNMHKLTNPTDIVEQGNKNQLAKRMEDKAIKERKLNEIKSLEAQSVTDAKFRLNTKSDSAFDHFMKGMSEQETARVDELAMIAGRLPDAHPSNPQKIFEPLSKSIEELEVPIVETSSRIDSTAKKLIHLIPDQKDLPANVMRVDASRDLARDYFEYLPIEKDRQMAATKLTKIRQKIQVEIQAQAKANVHDQEADITDIYLGELLNEEQLAISRLTRFEKEKDRILKHMVSKMRFDSEQAQSDFIHSLFLKMENTEMQSKRMDAAIVIRNVAKSNIPFHMDNRDEIAEELENLYFKYRELRQARIRKLEEGTSKQWDVNLPVDRSSEIDFTNACKKINSTTRGEILQLKVQEFSVKDKIMEILDVKEDTLFNLFLKQMQKPNENYQRLGSQKELTESLRALRISKEKIEETLSSIDEDLGPLERDEVIEKRESEVLDAPINASALPDLEIPKLPIVIPQEEGIIRRTISSLRRKFSPSQSASSIEQKKAAEAWQTTIEERERLGLDSSLAGKTIEELYEVPDENYIDFNIVNSDVINDALLTDNIVAPIPGEQASGYEIPFNSINFPESFPDQGAIPKQIIHPERLFEDISVEGSGAYEPITINIGDTNPTIDIAHEYSHSYPEEEMIYSSAYELTQPTKYRDYLTEDWLFHTDQYPNTKWIKPHKPSIIAPYSRDQSSVEFYDDREMRSGDPRYVGKAYEASPTPTKGEDYSFDTWSKRRFQRENVKRYSTTELAKNTQKELGAYIPQLSPTEEFYRAEKMVLDHVTEQQYTGNVIKNLVAQKKFYSTEHLPLIKHSKAQIDAMHDLEVKKIEFQYEKRIMELNHELDIKRSYYEMNSHRDAAEDFILGEQQKVDLQYEQSNLLQSSRVMKKDKNLEQFLSSTKGYKDTENTVTARNLWKEDQQRDIVALKGEKNVIDNKLTFYAEKIHDSEIRAKEQLKEWNKLKFRSDKNNYKDELDLDFRDESVTINQRLNEELNDENVLHSHRLLKHRQIGTSMQRRLNKITEQLNEVISANVDEAKVLTTLTESRTAAMLKAHNKDFVDTRINSGGMEEAATLDAENIVRYYHGGL